MSALPPLSGSKRTSSSCTYPAGEASQARRAGITAFLRGCRTTG